MLPDSFINRSGWEVDSSIPINDNGAEKIVYPVRKLGILYAAKIFREQDIWGNAINRQQESEREYSSYQATSKSPLGRFVPSPIQMISDHGRDIGLVIDWRNGITLVEGYGRIFLAHQIIGQLEEILRNLPEKLWLNPDTLTDKNIGWDGSTIWLAEPRLQRYKKSTDWSSTIEGSVSYLYQNYCR